MNELLHAMGRAAVVALPVALVAGVVSHVLTGWSIRLAHARSLLAQVNERSSHATPTPRVGGIGLMAGTCVGFLLLTVALMVPGLGEFLPGPTIAWLPLMGLVIPVAGAFALGLWDDRSDPPALAKLAAQLLIAVIPPLLGWRWAGMDPMLSIPLTAAWILLVMNAVNFMDGINGLAGTFGLMVGICFILMIPDGGMVVVMGGALAGASVGFLRWNFPKARTFMGDCGSQPLGVLAALLVVAPGMGSGGGWIVALAGIAALSVFLLDVIYTLVRRQLRGENILRAHREHLYQRHLLATGEDHGRTLAFVAWHMAGTMAASVAMALSGNAVVQIMAGIMVVVVLAHYVYAVHRNERRARLEATP